jgi:hypothetical protein
VGVVREHPRTLVLPDVRERGVGLQVVLSYELPLALEFGPARFKGQGPAQRGEGRLW